MKTKAGFSLYLIMALLITVISSCEKDRASLLTDGVWNFENITTSSEDDAIKTFIAGIKAAYTDGTMQFFSDGTYSKEFPLIVNETGTWELVGDTQLVFSPSTGGAITASVDKISKSELVLIETFIDQDSNTVNATLTWIK